MSRTVAAVVPVYNGAAFVEEAVRSVLEQTHPVERIVVVDDGSTDGTAEVLDRFGDQIDVVRQHNSGVAIARNVGAARCDADLLAFLDADDVWHPTKMERQVDRFMEDPSLGLVHCGLIEIDETGAEVGRRADGQEGWIAPLLVRWEEVAMLGGGSGAVFRSDLFRELGGYDPALSTSADWDLFVRFAIAAPVGFVPDHLLSYRLHGSNMHANLALLERDMTYALDKTFRAHPALAIEHRRARANLDFVLGAEHIKQGAWRPGLRHLARAIGRRPALITRVGAGAARRLS